MTKKKHPEPEAPAPVSNLVLSLREDFHRYHRLEEERKAIGAQLSEIRAEWRAEGMDANAVKAVIKIAAMDEERRSIHDETTALAREAAHIPFNAQGDLFNVDDGAGDEEAFTDGPDFTEEQEAGAQALADLAPHSLGKQN